MGTGETGPGQADPRPGQGETVKLWYDLFETSQGWIGVLASTKGLRRSTVPQPSPDLCYAMLGAEVETAEPSAQRFEALREKLIRLS